MAASASAAAPAESGMEGLLTTTMVAQAFSVHRQTVGRWVKQGKLTVIRTPGGHRRFRESEIRSLLRG
jgi:excisionase family DNA binding protein